MENQLYIFTIFILNGFLIGILFDLFRISRKSFKTIDLITYIEDVFFWILTGFIILYSTFKFSKGELRLYIFIGILLGFSLYMLIFSKLFIKVSIYIIKILKIAFNYIFLIPIQFLIKLLKNIIFKPISFIFINFRKTLSKLKINLHKKKKNNKLKKDLI